MQPPSRSRESALSALQGKAGCCERRHASLLIDICEESGTEKPAEESAEPFSQPEWQLAPCGENEYATGAHKSARDVAASFDTARCRHGDTAGSFGERDLGCCVPRAAAALARSACGPAGPAPVRRPVGAARAARLVVAGPARSCRSCSACADQDSRLSSRATRSRRAAGLSGPRCQVFVMTGMMAHGQGSEDGAFASSTSRPPSQVPRWLGISSRRPAGTCEVRNLVEVRTVV
jgi:hypothetical protein